MSDETKEQEPTDKEGTVKKTVLRKGTKDKTDKQITKGVSNV